MYLGRKKLSKELNFLEQGCIFGTAMGVPVMYAGVQCVRLYGTLAALAYILIGNLIIWLFSLSILSLSLQENDAIQNIKRYVGKKAGILISSIFLLAFIFWYTLQIDVPSRAIPAMLNLTQSTNAQYRIALIIGLLVSFISLGGIKAIKRVCLCAFPFLILYPFYTLARFGLDWTPTNHYKINTYSFYGLLIIIFSWLAFALNITTVTRHSKTKVDSYLSLSLMTLIHIFFQSFAALTFRSQRFYNFGPSQSHLDTFLELTFIVLGCICTNLLNIYYASASWENLVSRKWRSKRVEEKFHSSRQKYAIIGMLGTLTYLFFQLFTYLQMTEMALSNFIALLGVIFVFTVTLKLVLKNHNRPHEIYIRAFSWVFACALVLIVQIYSPHDLVKQIKFGVLGCLIYLFIMFGKETFHFYKQKFMRRRKNSE